MAPGGSGSGSSQWSLSCLLLCQPSAGAQQAAHTVWYSPGAVSEVAFQGPFLLKFLLLLKLCGFPSSLAPLLSLRIGLVLFVLKETEESVARIDASEEDTHNLSRREIYFQSNGKGRIQGLSFTLGGFQRLNHWKSKGHLLWALDTQRRSFHCNLEPNGKQVQKEKSLMKSPPGGQGKKQKNQLASLILSVIYLRGHLFHNISFFPNAYS